MRVIAGTARGHRLTAPPGRGVRPTADRVREALFSSLAAAVPGARVLDLFAGSGALGIEALSRGAAHATLVERDRSAAAVVDANLARTGLSDQATLRRGDAGEFVRSPTGGPFDIVLLDPPYDLPLPAVYELVTVLSVAGGLAPHATVVVERDRRDPDLDADPPAPLAADRDRTYGDTLLRYLVAVNEDERRSGRVGE